MDRNGGPRGAQHQGSPGKEAVHPTSRPRSLSEFEVHQGPLGRGTKVHHESPCEPSAPDADPGAWPPSTAGPFRWSREGDEACSPAPWVVPSPDLDFWKPRATRRSSTV